MNITSREMACGILGIPVTSDLEAIKNAYKALVKLYHPDAGGIGDTQSYTEIVDAYEFLIQNTHPENIVKTSVNAPVPPRSAKVIGSTNGYVHDDASAWEKKVKKHQKKKKEEFWKKADELTKKKQHEEETFRKAIEAIEAVRTAEALRAIIEAEERTNPRKTQNTKKENT